jgi:hypothetical protein
MIKPLLLRTLVAGLLVSSSAAQAVTVRYEPASQWRVDNEPQICRLSRDYRSGDGQITIRIEQFQPDATMQLMLIGKPIERAENRSTFDVRLGSNAASFRSEVADITLPDGRIGTLFRGVQFVRPNPTSPYTWPGASQFAQIDEMAFEAPRMGTIVLQTKTLPRAMDEMRKCHRQMIAGWGFDPEVQESLMRHAEPADNPASWLSFKDYPQSALRHRRSSIVVFRLNVDETGQPSACFVPRSYTPQDFVATTCEVLMGRARFKPALDASGKPVASYFVNTVAWMAF